MWRHVCQLAPVPCIKMFKHSVALVLFYMVTNAASVLQTKFRTLSNEVLPPGEVLPIHLLVLVQIFEMFCQFLRRFEIVHMDEGICWYELLIIGPGWTKNHRNGAGYHRVEELFRDVVFMDGVLKR